VRLGALLLAVGEGLPIFVNLTIWENLRLALGISDLNDARLGARQCPGRFLKYSRLSLVNEPSAMK